MYLSTSPARREGRRGDLLVAAQLEDLVARRNLAGVGVEIQPHLLYVRVGTAAMGDLDGIQRPGEGVGPGLELHDADVGRALADVGIRRKR